MASKGPIGSLGITGPVPVLVHMMDHVLAFAFGFVLVFALLS